MVPECDLSTENGAKVQKLLILIRRNVPVPLAMAKGRFWGRRTKCDSLLDSLTGSWNHCIGRSSAPYCHRHSNRHTCSHVASSRPFCSQSHRVLPYRQRPDLVVQLALCPSYGRRLYPAHRGHRQERNTETFLNVIYDSLTWLGLETGRSPKVGGAFDLTARASGRRSIANISKN